MGAASTDAGWERLFWAVFERTSNPVILADDEQTIIAANDAAVALRGGTREELIGSSLLDGIDPSEREQAAREWQDFLSSGRVAGSRVALRADGSRIPVDYAAQMATVDGRRMAVYVLLDTRTGPALSIEAAGDELPLTDREREVITLIALGRDTNKIAEQLFISPETVRTHVRNAMAKLGVRTRAQLVAVVLCRSQAVHPACVER